MKLRRGTHSASDTSSPTITTNSDGLQIAYGAFDFTSGAFTRAARTRRILIGVLLLCAALLTMLFLQGTSARLSAAHDSAQIERDQASTRATTDKIGELDKAGGYSATELESHVSARESAVRSATSTELDIPRLIGATYTAAPSGTTINLINVTSTSAAGNASAGSATARPRTPTPAPSSTATPSGSGTMKVTAIATTFDSIAEFKANVAKIPGVASVNGTWTGGQDAWNVELTATLNNEALSGRGNTLTMKESGH